MMLIYYDLEQRSPAWHAMRVRPTASNFDRLITAGGKPSASANDYIAEILAAHYGIYKLSFESPAMAAGTRLEPDARAAYEFITGAEIRQAGFVVVDGSPFSPGCSPDGLIGDDGGLEIKCPEPWNHLATVISGTMPDKYRPQVQGSMFVTGRQWWDFVSYCPGYNTDGAWVALPMRLQTIIVRQLRDNEYIEKLGATVLAASQALIKLTNNDF